MRNIGIHQQLLHPKAVARAKSCLKKSGLDWDYLCGITGNGPIAKLESRLLKEAGGRHCLALSNCTSALLAALLAAGIGRGDEVILPAYTSWTGTLAPLLLLGARPVFADISPCSLTIDPKSVKRLITDRTKAIIAIHLFGHPADMPALWKLARAQQCVLIADAAQGLGCLIEGKPVGHWGDFVALSFGRSKLLCAGEGGALICNNRPLFERAVAVCQHPVRMHRQIDDDGLRDHVNRLAPLNMRMHPVVAALALGQLEGLAGDGEFLKLRESRRFVVKMFTQAGLGHLLPRLVKGSQASGHYFPLIIQNQKDARRAFLLCQRHGLMLTTGGVHTPLHQAEFLQENGIGRVSAAGSLSRQLVNTERRCSRPQYFAKPKG